MTYTRCEKKEEEGRGSEKREKEQEKKQKTMKTMKTNKQTNKQAKQNKTKLNSTQNVVYVMHRKIIIIINNNK